MRIALAQLDCALGDIKANLTQAQDVVASSGRDGADLVVFPELFLTGYTLADVGEDVALETDDERLLSIDTPGGETTAAVIGFQEGGRHLHTYNSASYLEAGSVIHTHRKAYLVTYNLFEESKHFTPGSTMRAFDSRLGRMAMLVCNDLWQPALVFIAVQDGANILLVPANSADSETSDIIDTQTYWRNITRFYASMFECFVVFVNRVGTEGRLKFWGGSHVVNPRGEFVAEAPRDHEAVVMVDVDLAEVRRRRREVPLVKQARLALLVKELHRLVEEGGDL